MTQDNETIIVGKNRKRAFWSFAIILFMAPVSAWLVVTGLRPGRPEVAWVLIIIGAAGVVLFTAAAVAIVRTMRSSWHLALSPARLTLYTKAYDLSVPWDGLAGIVVDEVNRRPGCALIFKDSGQVARAATFHNTASRPPAVTDAATMEARMQENYDALGYHFGIPGRLLELGPEALAELLVKAQAGELWQEGERHP